MSIITCLQCDGRGVVPKWNGSRQCPECGGLGRIPIEDNESGATPEKALADEILAANDSAPVSANVGTVRVRVLDPKQYLQEVFTMWPQYRTLVANDLKDGSEELRAVRNAWIGGICATLPILYPELLSNEADEIIKEEFYRCI